MRDQELVEKYLNLFQKVKLAWVAYLLGVISNNIRAIGISFSEESKTITLEVYTESELSSDEIDLYDDAEAEFIAEMDSGFFSDINFNIVGGNFIESPNWGFIFKRLE